VGLEEHLAGVAVRRGTRLDRRQREGLEARGESRAHGGRQHADSREIGREATRQSLVDLGGAIRWLTEVGHRDAQHGGVDHAQILSPRQR